MACFTIVLCSLLFGFGTSCAVALGVRFALGLGNGLVGTAKTCVADFLNKEQQARGMAYLIGLSIHMRKLVRFIFLAAYPESDNNVFRD